jgi:hypothetical protein
VTKSRVKIQFTVYRVNQDARLTVLVEMTHSNVCNYIEIEAVEDILPCRMWDDRARGG